MARRSSPASAVSTRFPIDISRCASRGSSARIGRASSIRFSSARCEQDTVAAIADKVAVPTYTLDAARLLRPLLDRHRVDGVLHLCNAGACTWQEYGQFALDCASPAGVPLKARTVGPQKMADLTAFIAKRPLYTGDVDGEARRDHRITPRPWQEAVEAHVRRSLGLAPNDDPQTSAPMKVRCLSGRGAELGGRYPH